MIDYSGVDTEFLAGGGENFLQWWIFLLLLLFCFFKDRSNHQKGWVRVLYSLHFAHYILLKNLVGKTWALWGWGMWGGL